MSVDLFAFYKDRFHEILQQVLQEARMKDCVFRFDETKAQLQLMYLEKGQPTTLTRELAQSIDTVVTFFLDRCTTELPGVRVTAELLGPIQVAMNYTMKVEPRELDMPYVWSNTDGTTMVTLIKKVFDDTYVQDWAYDPTALEEEHQLKLFYVGGEPTTRIGNQLFEEANQIVHWFLSKLQFQLGMPTIFAAFPTMFIEEKTPGLSYNIFPDDLGQGSDGIAKLHLWDYLTRPHLESAVAEVLTNKSGKWQFVLWFSDFPAEVELMLTWGSHTQNHNVSGDGRQTPRLQQDDIELAGTIAAEILQKFQELSGITTAWIAPKPLTQNPGSIRYQIYLNPSIEEVA